MQTKYSAEEQNFIRNGIKDGVRVDLRELNESRNTTILTREQTIKEGFIVVQHGFSKIEVSLRFVETEDLLTRLKLKTKKLEKSEETNHKLVKNNNMEHGKMSSLKTKNKIDERITGFQENRRMNTSECDKTNNILSLKEKHLEDKKYKLVTTNIYLPFDIKIPFDIYEKYNLNIFLDIRVINEDGSLGYVVFYAAQQLLKNLRVPFFLNPKEVEMHDVCIEIKPPVCYAKFDDLIVLDPTKEEEEAADMILYQAGCQLVLKSNNYDVKFNDFLNVKRMLKLI